MTINLGSKLDRFDLKILDIVAQDGRITLTALAERVGLSKTPCQARFRQLMADGFIEGFRAVLNPVKLGLSHIAFVEVKLSSTNDQALRRFNEEIKKINEVEECHMIAGRYDYLVKVRTTDIASYRRVLGECISSIPNVASTSTSVVMEPIKEAGGSQKI
jgi:Lrp/AsnC family leucine-responsive transcriptional regulator